VNGDLTIRASFSYTSAAWTRTVRLMNAGHLEVTALTHRVLLERFDAALEALAARRERPCKVVLVIGHREPDA
jgi:threonine dehydrogenase-like Zn-dependent dehydrogenase